MLAQFQQVAGRRSPTEPLIAAGENPRSAEKSARLRVLVVDDEGLIRWSLAETLRESGFDVLEAADGREAMAVLTREAPDVVLLDYRLPDSNDLSLLSAIRRTAPWTPVIMMTAFGTPEVVTGALQLGAALVINKPFEMGEIGALVARAHCLAPPR